MHLEGERSRHVAIAIREVQVLHTFTARPRHSVGVNGSQPLDGSFAFAAAALGVGDRLLGGQGGVLGPRSVKGLNLGVTTNRPDESTNGRQRVD